MNQDRRGEHNPNPNLEQPEGKKLSEEGKYFLKVSLADEPQSNQVPGKSVIEGKVQNGEFD